MMEMSPIANNPECQRLPTSEMIEVGAEALWKMAQSPGRERPWEGAAEFVKRCFRNEVAAVWAAMSAKIS